MELSSAPPYPGSQNIRRWWEWGRIQRGNLVKIYVHLATVALKEQIKDQQDSRQKSSCGHLWEGKQRSDLLLHVSVCCL